jgi:peroxiredoxin Q/BCP
MASGVKPGDKAPDFTLTSQSGQSVRLYDRLRSKVVVLYFYPKDETPGCTAEACAFRDSYEVFTDAGAEVIDKLGLRRQARRLRQPPQPAVHPAER